MLGPRGTPTDAHATGVSTLLTGAGSNQLCATCHSTDIGPVIGVARDFVTSRQAERGRSCVGCHMGLVQRRGADGDEAGVREVRSHALQTPRDPAFLARAFSLRFETDDDHSRLILTNQAGHRVPGLIGREITFRAELLDESGAVLEQAELVLDAASYLPVDGRRTLNFHARGTGVRVTGLHLDPRLKKRVTFLEETTR
jgi:hypothetical protein